MVVCLTQRQAGLKQEHINSILRPHKQKFRRGPIPGAQAKMKQFGEKNLLFYRPQPRPTYDTYYDFSSKTMKPNLRIPPIGRTVRVTDLDGNPIVIKRRRVQGDKFR